MTAFAALKNLEKVSTKNRFL